MLPWVTEVPSSFFNDWIIFLGVNVQASYMEPVVKNPSANAGDTRDTGSIPGSERSPGAGHETAFSLSYHSLKDLKVIFLSWPLWILLQWTWKHRYFFVLSKILMYVYHWTSNFLFLSVKGQWLSLYINLHFVSLKSSSGQIIGCGIAGKKLKLLTMELSLKAETQLFGTLLLGTASRMTLECIRSSKYVQTVNQLSSPWSRRRLVPRGTGFLSPRSSRSIRTRVAWCGENRAWGQTASSPTEAWGWTAAPCVTVPTENPQGAQAAEWNGLFAPGSILWIPRIRVGDLSEEMGFHSLNRRGDRCLQEFSEL